MMGLGTDVCTVVSGLELNNANMQTEKASETERERERERERWKQTDLDWVLPGLIRTVQVGENGHVDAVQSHRTTER